MNTLYHRCIPNVGQRKSIRNAPLTGLKLGLFLGGIADTFIKVARYLFETF